jgi:hypothetical protein
MLLKDFSMREADFLIAKSGFPIYINGISVMNNGFYITITFINEPNPGSLSNNLKYLLFFNTDYDIIQHLYQ